MNKKSRKRAFFVYAIMCLFYVVVVFRLPEKIHMARTSDRQAAPARSAVLPFTDGKDTAVTKAAPEEKTAEAAIPAKGEPASAAAAKPDVQASAQQGITPPGSEDMEPSLLIAVPVVCYAMRERWVEKDSLIFTKKDVNNNVTWKKPVEILRDHDEEGIRSILGTIGKKRVVEFLKKEGVGISADLDPEDIMLGKGYRVEKQRLLTLYNKYVAGTCDDIFPFSVKQIGIAKDATGFYLTKGRESSREGMKPQEAEWMMPNLANLPIRLAVEKLSPHTSRVRVQGSGHVVNQSPRAFERLRGEQECVIQGRSPNE